MNCKMIIADYVYFWVEFHNYNYKVYGFLFQSRTGKLLGTFKSSGEAMQFMNNVRFA